MHRKFKLKGKSLKAIIASQRLLFKVPSNTDSGIGQERSFWITHFDFSSPRRDSTCSIRCSLKLMEMLGQEVK